MTNKQQLKSPTDFLDPKEWREYVRQTVSPEEVNYTLAFGRTTLFLRLYGTRAQPFPSKFRDELTRIVHLRDPDRTRTLEALNDRIFADVTLMLAGELANVENREDKPPTVSGNAADQLYGYLAAENPYFARWVRYKEGAEWHVDALSWEEFVSREFGPANGAEVEFTLLMGQLGELLQYFRARGLALPEHYFERAWFLHLLFGVERNVQTRGLVQEFVEAMGSCASA
jgi:hypothetical protein